MTTNEMKAKLLEIKEDNIEILSVEIYTSKKHKAIVVVESNDRWGIKARDFTSYERMVAWYIRNELKEQI